MDTKIFMTAYTIPIAMEADAIATITDTTVTIREMIPITFSFLFMGTSYIQKMTIDFLSYYSIIHGTPIRPEHFLLKRHHLYRLRISFLRETRTAPAPKCLLLKRENVFHLNPVAHKYLIV